MNNTLGIERTANVLWGQNEEFDFRIYPTPISLENAIREKSAAGHTARLTAGFCWKWSLPNADGTLKDDVVIGDYRRPGTLNRKLESWRGNTPASLWAYDPNGINQIGCIYTAQGFEFDYVGVIFGRTLSMILMPSSGWVFGEVGDNVVKRSVNQFTDLVKNTYRFC